MSADEKSLDERHILASKTSARALASLYDIILDLERASGDYLEVAEDAEKRITDLQDLVIAAKHSAVRHYATAVKARALLSL